jgi:hypothetical protein
MHGTPHNAEYYHRGTRGEPVRTVAAAEPGALLHHNRWVLGVAHVDILQIDRGTVAMTRVSYLV